MTIFEYENYKDFVRSKIKAMPKKGHGQHLKIANLLGIHTTMVTHIFKGHANLSVEQALKLAEYFGLRELEQEYFITLVQLERASNQDSRRFFNVQLQRLQERALNLKERFEPKKILDEKDQAMFYSAWYYSGIHLLIALHPYASAAQIANDIGLPVKTVNKVLNFLFSTGLLEESDGVFKIGQAQTYVDRDSPLVIRHHSNWRQKSIEHLEKTSEEELIFTNPITVSKKDFFKIREEIIFFLDKFRKIADPSPPEELCCLNIDWIKLSEKR